MDPSFTLMLDEFGMILVILPMPAVELHTMKLPAASVHSSAQP